MAETVITVANVADVTPEVIANEALGMLTADAQLINAVTRDASLEAAREGQTVKIGKRGSLTANQKIGGEKVTPQAPSMDAAEATLEHWEVTFSLEDIVKTITKDGMQLDLGYISDAIGVLREKIEEKIAALFADATLTEVGDADEEVSEDFVLAARKELTDKKAPQADRYLALSSRQTNVALKIDRFTRADAYGKSGQIADGALGKIASFNVLESPFVPVTATVEKGAAFHKWGIALATRKMQSFVPDGVGVKIGYVEKDGILFRVVISYNAQVLATQITVDCLFGVGFLRKDLVVRVLTDGNAVAEA
jgi:hypothetical protein